jgi:hypothetical protein
LPIVDLPDDELVALTAALRSLIEGDKFRLSPRLDRLRAALARLEAAAEPTPQPKASTSLETKKVSPAKADKRARR